MEYILPTNYLKKLHENGKGSLEYLEKEWDVAKKAAEDHGHKEDYAYITGIFQRLIGIKSYVLCNLKPRHAKLSAADRLSWKVYALNADFMGFIAKQKVLVRKDTESPEAKRGITSYWVLSPKQKRVVRWSDDIFKESVYKNSVQVVTDVKYDNLFWSLVEPILRENLKQRRRFAYEFYSFEKQPVKISDSINTIVLKPGTMFTCYKYGKMWSLRAINKLGKLVEVDGLTEALIKKLIGMSKLLPPVPQPTKLDLLKDPTQKVRQYT